MTINLRYFPLHPAKEFTNNHQESASVGTRYPRAILKGSEDKIQYYQPKTLPEPADKLSKQLRGNCDRQLRKEIQRIPYCSDKSLIGNSWKNSEISHQGGI